MPAVSHIGVVAVLMSANMPEMEPKSNAPAKQPIVAAHNGYDIRSGSADSHWITETSKAK